MATLVKSLVILIPSPLEWAFELGKEGSRKERCIYNQEYYFPSLCYDPKNVLCVPSFRSWLLCFKESHTTNRDQIRFGDPGNGGT